MVALPRRRAVTAGLIRRDFLIHVQDIRLEAVVWDFSLSLTVAEKLENFKNKFRLTGSPHSHQIEKSGNKVLLSVRKTPEDLGWPSLRVLETRVEDPLSRGTNPSARAAFAVRGHDSGCRCL